MSSVEMDFATSALFALQLHGFVELRYETAQFEPYSSQNRPDILFSPGSGPYRGLPYLVELRMPETLGRRLPTHQVLVERQAFLKDQWLALRFALATTRKVDNALRLALSSSQIELFDEIKSGDDLGARILTWSAAARQRTSSHSQPFLLKMPLQQSHEIPLAARTDSLNIRNPALASSFVEGERHSDEEIFKRIFGEDIASKNAENLFLQLREFFNDGNLGFFEDRIDFLGFLKKTVTEHQYTSNFDKENLRRWFRQFNSEVARGSKP
jgi:hypothetical protein